MRRPARAGGGGGDSLLPSTVHQLSQDGGSRRAPRRSRRQRRDGNSFVMICAILSVALVTVIGLAFFFLHKSGHMHHHHPARSHSWNQNRKQKNNYDSGGSENRRRRDYSTNNADARADNNVDDDADVGRERRRNDYDVIGRHQQNRMKNLIKDPPPKGDNRGVAEDPKLNDGRIASTPNERQSKGENQQKMDATKEQLLSTLPSNSIYRLATTDIMGKVHDLTQYIGKTTLLVNVACEWGLTKVNYEQLQELQMRFGTEQFAVLAFPSNDFHQELETNAEINNYIKTNFPQVTFPIMSKSSLSENAIYQTIMQQHLPQAKVRWNFGKFLVNQKGIAVRVFDSKVEPSHMVGDIQRLIASQ